MPNAILPTGFKIDEREAIFGPAGNKSKAERKSEQARYRRAKKMTARGKRRKKQSKKKIKSGN